MVFTKTLMASGKQATWTVDGGLEGAAGDGEDATGNVRLASREDRPGVSTGHGASRDRMWAPQCRREKCENGILRENADWDGG